ncbi:MAG: glycosyltransferase family 2 protein, partial [Actinobacteria bacterium]|nr:glycosyltransferase family 2 protein [Actinomycetota bacterium]
MGSRSGIRVSIIVPAHNEETRLSRSLPRLVDTLSCQPDTEVIVVDDGSQDGTSSVAVEHLSRFRLAKVMRLPWKSGKGAAVRMGVSVATGEAVVFMDA